MGVIIKALENNGAIAIAKASTLVEDENQWADRMKKSGVRYTEKAQLWNSL